MPGNRASVADPSAGGRAQQYLPAATSALWVLPALLLLLIAVLRMPSFVGQVFDPDETAISAQAIPLVEGGTMYIDAIDRKPPLPVFVYALSHAITGNTDLRLLHLLAGLLLFVSALLIANEARRTATRDGANPEHASRAALWGGLLMVTAALAMTPVDGQATNYAHLALAPATLAIVASRRRTTAWAFVCGFSLCVAVLARQTWTIGAFPAAWGIIRYGDWRRGLPAAFVGGLIPIGITALAVPWDDFYYWVFSSNDGFVFEGVDLTAALLRGLGTFAMFALGHLVVMWFSGRSAKRTLRSDPDLWLWLLTGTIALAAGFRFWGHYWLQIVPVLALLAAIELPRRPQPSQRRAATLVAATALVAFVLAWTPGSIRSLPDPTDLASVVEANTTSADTVLIWGNFPEVLWKANRSPAGGLVHMDFVTGRSGGREHGPHTIERAAERALPHLLELMRENPPRLVLDTSPAGLRSYDLYPMELFSELNEFVQANYVEIDNVDGVVVLACAVCEPAS